MKQEFIDHGFILISGRDARILGGGRLPRHGYEKLVVHEGHNYWLARTVHNSKIRWSIRPTDWRIAEDGHAYLGSKELV